MGEFLNHNFDGSREVPSRTTSDTASPAEYKELATWRDYLTPEEAAVVLASDDLKAKWQATVAERAFIMNRAIQRKRYAERKS